MEKLEEENDELQKIRLKAQSQAIKIALINKVSNIIRESVDISVILIIIWPKQELLWLITK